MNARSPGTTAARRPECPSRRGFTLTEMLVTITVIALLAGLALAGLHSARETARIAKTKSTVMKLHNIVMEMYGSYQTRRLPISTTGLSPKQAAEARLKAIRDIMRMEMPERWSDVDTGPLFVSTRPALSNAYVRYKLERSPSGDVSSAECLYMLVTLSDAESREDFSESEVGDTDNDGAPEFVDAWGHPIYFFRWAPGFLPSNGADTDLQTGDVDTDHDPLDTMRVDSLAYRLVPLIYSAGPDGASGLDAASSYTWNNDTYSQTFGRPTEGTHYDNIHNHRLEVR